MFMTGVNEPPYSGAGLICRRSEDLMRTGRAV